MSTQSTRSGTSTAKERLLAAARTLVERDGVDDLTVGPICELTGLSRATFYVHFSTRDDLIQTLFLEEAAKVISGSSDLASEHPAFGELCVEAIVTGLETIRSNAVLRALFSSERASATSRLASTSQAFLALAYDFWEPLVRDAQRRGEVRAGLEPSAVVRWLLRIFLSYLEEDPGSTAPDVMREELRMFLLPAFVHRQPREAGAIDPETDRVLDQLTEQSDQLRAALDALRQQLRR